MSLMSLMSLFLTMSQCVKKRHERHIATCASQFEFQRNDSTIAGSTVFVKNSIIIVQKIGVGVQVSGQHMGEQGDVCKLSVELRRCAAPFRRKRRDQLGNGKENGVWRRSPDLGFRFNELPDAFFVIELEQQLLILLVASDDAQHMPNNSKKNVFKIVLSQKEAGAAIPLIILMVIVSFVNKNFFGLNNLMDVLRTASFWIMIAVPMTFLLCSGGIDLSLGAATSIGGVVCGKALKAGCSIPVAILLALAVGLLIGLMNGVCIVKFKLPGFILTLGTQYCLNGIINVWTSGLSISNFAKEYTRIGQFRIGKVVPIPIVYAVIIALIGHIILTRSKLGRKILAVGGNEETARLAGINVDKMKILTYVFVSVMACFAGVIYGARFATVQPAIGTGSEMNIIAAVIVGGTSMMGGVGTIVGTVIGSVLMAMITNVLIMLGVSAYWQAFVFGFILIVSLFIDRYRQRSLNA